MVKVKGQKIEKVKARTNFVWDEEWEKKMRKKNLHKNSVSPFWGRGDKNS